jgi:phage-related protein
MPKPRSKRSPFLKDIDRLEVDIHYFVNPKGKCPVEDDFLNDPQKVSKDQKAKLAALMRRYAVEGEIKGDQRCHRLKGRVRDFWVLKAHQHRLYFFKEGNDRIIITHGFKKQTDKLRPEEEDRMLSYREIYNNLSLYK